MRKGTEENVKKMLRCYGKTEGSLEKVRYRNEGIMNKIKVMVKEE